MPNTKAIWLMVAAMAAFAVCDMFVKFASETLGTGQVVLLLGIGAFLTFYIALRREGGRLIRPNAMHPALVVRTFGEFLASTCVVIALSLIPFVTFSSIIQAQPLAVMLGAGLFLREQVGWRRWLAVGIGFLGVMIVLRPGPTGFEMTALWAVLAVIGMTMRDLGTRALPAGIPTSFAASWGLLAVIAGGVLIMPFTGGWKPMDAWSTLWVLLMIASGTAAYLAITLAMRIGEASAITSFRYSRIIFAMLIGYLVFGERPDLWVWVGTSVIIVSGLYAMMRERALARARASA